MNTVTTLQIQSHDSADTEKLAARIGAKLRGSEIIVLSSDLGGGKTTFVRGLAHGMGFEGVVNSPTFTISREYAVPSRDLTLHHFDFYRLAEPGLMSLELAEFIEDPRSVVVIEWADIVEGVVPRDAVHITFRTTGETDRDIILEYAPSRNYLFGETESCLY